jgi:molybdate/tungstate transport system substrate-binding protein
MIPDHASWNIRFAANELCLAYTGKSREAARIDTGNWYRILMEPDVRYGRSDPDSDPCGYRTILALKLNGIMHPGEDNWQRLLDKDRRYIRGKETDLNALLESQTIDYMFNYRSVAVQHGYHFVELPDSINLSLPELDGWYAKASIDVRGSEPGSKVTQTGSSIVYGVTIPSHAENPELADTFVRFMLGSTGREIMAKSGQIPLDPEFSPKSKVANSLF